MAGGAVAVGDQFSAGVHWCLFRLSGARPGRQWRIVEGQAGVALPQGEGIARYGAGAGQGKPLRKFQPAHNRAAAAGVKLAGHDDRVCLGPVAGCLFNLNLPAAVEQSRGIAV